MKDTASLQLKEKSRILYVGFNAQFYNAFKKHFGQTEMLNATLENFKKMNTEIAASEIVEKNDLVIIDAEYPDASELIALCRKSNLDYLMLLVRPLKLEAVLHKYSPERILIIFDKNRINYQTAAEIYYGLKSIKGKLPFKSLKIPSHYVEGL
jgi:hypothetical protein